MTTEARIIRQAYEEGKAFMKPEIERLKAEIVELKRQLLEKVAIAPNSGTDDNVDPGKPTNPKLLLDSFLDPARNDNAAHHSIS